MLFKSTCTLISISLQGMRFVDLSSFSPHLCHKLWNIHPLHPSYSAPFFLWSRPQTTFQHPSCQHSLKRLHLYIQVPSKIFSYVFHSSISLVSLRDTQALDNCNSEVSRSYLCNHIIMNEINFICGRNGSKPLLHVGSWGFTFQIRQETTCWESSFLSGLTGSQW